jgi:hypothetical protein
MVYRRAAGKNLHEKLKISEFHENPRKEKGRNRNP